MIAEESAQLRPTPLRAPSDERRAPIESLTVIKQRALLLCLEGDGTLHKRSGAWTSHARPQEARVSGVTVADLARDGLLTIVVREKRASACLTPRGAWFARTAAREQRYL
jgi:hypothetical protein